MKIGRKGDFQNNGVNNMSDTDKIQITQNDKGYKLNFTVKDADGEVVNLTDKTISFQVAEKVTFTEKFAGACVIVGAALGTCSYLVATGNFDTVNNYYGTLQLTEDGDIQTTRRFCIEVIAELAT